MSCAARLRTRGSSLVASTAATADDVIVETIAATASERGATRMDDRANDAAMERRKKEGYF